MNTKHLTTSHKSIESMVFYHIVLVYIFQEKLILCKEKEWVPYQITQYSVLSVYLVFVVILSIKIFASSPAAIQY